MQIRATTITDFDRRELIVPNKKFITDDVMNWTLSDHINRLLIEIGVAYGSDTELARKLLLEAAQDLGAGPVKSFLRVTLPLSMPGVFAGSLLTFIPAIGDFINSELLGSRNTTMIGNVTQRLFLTNNDYPQAAAISFILMGGILIGVFVGRVWWLRSLTEPVFEFFRALPPPVLVPILMVLIGANDQMKVAVIVSGAIWPVLLNTVEGVRNVDPTLRDTCDTYGIHRLAQYRYLVLPSAGPQIMAGVRQALSIGLILMVISEMFASSSGIGFTIVQFQRSFAVPAMWSGIVLLGLIGVLMSLLFQFTERRVLAWYHGQREVQRGR
jgi:ABC-type nitrate/sulfonate/bicarbonate transport system permease component